MSFEIKNLRLSSHDIADEACDNDIQQETHKPSIQAQQSAMNKLSQLFKEAHEIITNTPVIDEARCAYVRDKIQNSAWFDADRIAEKLMSFEDTLFETPPKKAK